MENMDKKEVGDCCHGENCSGMMKHMHGCHGGKHCLIKMVLKLFILMLIFWLGFKLGEITGFVKSERGFGGDNNRSGYGMMRGFYYGNQNSISLPTGPAQPTIPVK